jgi:NADH:ubiquinone oxidoreductase subunit 4 (subunit M)
MAHVEAPTFGSIVLAGVLLKLGGVGLIRCYCLIDLTSIKFFLLSYFLVFLVYATIVCCCQSDFKRLVAYSSVSHIMVVPILIFSFSSLRYKSSILVLLFHGFSSPLLFSFVGCVYSIYRTRQLISVRGLLLCSPLISFIFIAGFMFTLCIPPFPSYVSEVIFFSSSLSLWSLVPVILVLFGFLSLVYNLN